MFLYSVCVYGQYAVMKDVHTQSDNIILTYFNISQQPVPPVGSGRVTTAGSVRVHHHQRVTLLLQGEREGRSKCPENE